MCLRFAAATAFAVRTVSLPAQFAPPGGQESFTEKRPRLSTATDFALRPGNAKLGVPPPPPTGGGAGAGPTVRAAVAAGADRTLSLALNVKASAPENPVAGV